PANRSRASPPPSPTPRKEKHLSRHRIDSSTRIPSLDLKQQWLVGFLLRRHAMASLPLLRQVLVPALVLLCLSPACAARRVSVAVYYETLCPFCSGFVVNDLARIFRNGLSSNVDLRLVPFGNGRVSPDGSMSCQHGEDECQLNAIEACVISVWPDAVN
uniref:Gamma-interferon-inducible lysosomal thiol reductase n=1 Tax=Aegilops tauschii subsp. strangulata TaxID=200361 RepID=A0A453FUM6_AEGTS